MADDKGKALAAELAASPPAHAPTGAERPATCVACGAWHGGVGAGVLCLQREVLRLRTLLVRAGVAFALVFALARCGGAEFTTADPFARAGDASGSEPAGEDAAVHAPGSDAGAGEFRDADIASDASAADAPAPLGTQGQDDGSEAPDPSDDAGASLRDAGTSPPPPIDAGKPPALCCATPCSGSQVANITCGDWTCAAGSCGAGVCGIGALCSWMQGSCVGHVAVCP
jgi:hypothetical protein